MTQVKETGLLTEGMKSYPQALGALNEFVRLVVTDIRGVVIDELDRLSSAMGVELSKGEVGDYVRPSRLGTFDPKDTVVGVTIDRIGRWRWGLYFYLWWWKGEARLCVSIWLKDSDVAESIFNAFKESPSRSRVEIAAGREVYVSGALAPDQAEQLPVTLRQLTREFSELWSRAGALEKLPKP